MIYREAGEFRTSYGADAQTFPIRLDRWAYWALLAVAFGVVPFMIDAYWVNAIFLPFLIYAIAALGLNVLTGYCGQVSLGTGAFMAVGAYAVYKLMTAFPEVPFALHVLLAGGITAAVGALFGLPSLRIKGFYLAVATLAAQFFLIWLFNRVPWFYNYSASGQITAPEREVLGGAGDGARHRALGGLPVLPRLHRRLRLGGAQPHPRRARAAVDGDPRHGHRGRDHRGEPAPRQAHRLRGVVLLHRHRRGAVLRGVPGRGRAQRGVRDPASPS